ncbi:MAG: hypothetical protein KKH94_03650 [Candidatus Omnitrophica bacterium]|nr:hypothetical protein [Candidatus Omnitrophota bacterium]
MFSGYQQLNAQNILVIRSSTHLFSMVIHELRKTFPSARMSCLVTKDTVLSEEGVSLEQVFETPHPGAFRWRDIATMKKTLSSPSFDLAVVLYNSEKGYGYLNIDAYAGAARPHIILSVDSKKRIHCMSQGTFIFKCCHRTIDFLWSMLNTVVTVIVFIIIFLGMIVAMPLVALNRRLHQVPEG